MAGKSDGEPPPSEGRREKAETWRRILQAAHTVFARDGYLEATLASIASEAGLGKSTLYRHVESKADLLVETLISRDEPSEPAIAQALAGAPGAEAKLRALARAFLDFWERRPDYRPVLWALDNQDVIGSVSPELVDRAVSAWRPLIEALERVIAEGVESGELRDCDSHVAAHVFWNFSVLFLEIKYSHARRRLLGQPLERFYDEALELLLLGLVRRSA